MLFGLTHGEIGLIAFIFAMVYGAGLLPRLIKRIAPEGPKPAADGDREE